MRALFKKSWKGIRKNEILPIRDFDQMAYNGRMVTSVIVIKAVGLKTKSIPTPLELIDLIPDDVSS